MEKAPLVSTTSRQRQGGLRPRLRRLAAPRQPRRHLPAADQLQRRRHQRAHPRRRRQPDHLHHGRLQHAAAVPDREGLGGLRDPDRRLRRRQRRWRPGGVVNLVTRSGSNKFEFELNATADHDRLQLLPRPARHPRRRRYFYVINPTISGPIIKDRLVVPRQRRVPHPEDRPRPGRRGHAARPAARAAQLVQGDGQADLAGDRAQQAVSSVTNFDECWQHNTPTGWASTRTPRRTGRQRKYFTGLIWESLLTDDDRVPQPGRRHRDHRSTSTRPAATTTRSTATTSPPSIQTFPRAADAQQRQQPQPPRRLHRPVHEPARVVRQRQGARRARRRS